MKKTVTLLFTFLTMVAFANPIPVNASTGGSGVSINPFRQLHGGEDDPRIEPHSYWVDCGYKYKACDGVYRIEGKAYGYTYIIYRQDNKKRPINQKLYSGWLYR